jgi:hypothetical protein
MMLTWKESRWRPQQRSTPLDVTHNAFNEVPQVPSYIQKPDARVEVHDLGVARAGLHWRPFKSRQRSATPRPPNPTPWPSPNTSHDRVRTTSLPVCNQSAAAVIPTVLDTEQLHQNDRASFERIERLQRNAAVQSENTRSEAVLDPSPGLLPSGDGLIDSQDQGPSDEQPDTTDPLHPGPTVRPEPEAGLPSLPTVGTQDLCASSQRPLHCLADNCYIAIDVPVPKRFELESNPDLKIRLRNFLQYLRLRTTTGVIIDCVCASTTRDPRDLKPTILFLCLTKEQHQVISSALRQRAGGGIEVVPSVDYRYVVLIQKTQLCASGVSEPMDPGAFPRQVVRGYLNNGPSICGVLCSRSNMWSGAKCTLGGLIVVDGGVFGLTTSHSLLGPDDIPDRDIDVQDAQSKSSSLLIFMLGMPTIQCSDIS